MVQATGGRLTVKEQQEAAGEHSNRCFMAAESVTSDKGVTVCPDKITTQHCAAASACDLLTFPNC